ncbi:MAG: type II secretion system F family protein [Desulfobacterales bacterium]|nr:type II secretion system F family protein [Desulfobacterales bacterium]
MPIFEYVAVDSSGGKIKNTITAPDEGAAARLLQDDGFIIQNIRELTGAAADLSRFSLFQRVSNKQVVLFFRMFSSLIHSNVSVSEAMGILVMQAESRTMKKALINIKSDIEGGVRLSDAFARYPRIFEPLVTNMIRAGELGGILDVVLDRISDFLEGRAALKRKMILSLIYPTVVLVVTLAVVGFFVGFVIPRFASLLQGRQLPANTQFLLDVSQFLQTNMLGIGIGFFILAGTIVLLMKTEITRLYIDRYKIYLPVIGPILRYGTIVQFSKTFASLLESGITLIDGLKSVSGTVANLEVKRLIEEMTEKVLGGQALSVALQGQFFFTPMFVAMIKIGEETGLMDMAMRSVEDLHEKILVDKIAKMTAMIEPALIITLGVIVGYVAWGLVAGMFALYAG